MNRKSSIQMQSQPKNPTRNDVAAASGVSTATVSRVYNNPESVSPDKVKKVLETAEKLGYEPDKNASALRRNGTGIISLVQLKKPRRKYYWADMPVYKWFYADVLNAVKDVVDLSMYSLNLSTVREESDLQKLKSRCDGIICYDVDTAEEAEMIAAAGIPYIIGHHTEGFEGFSRCSTDNFHGGRMQAELLKETGCHKPVYITGYLDIVAPHRDRLNGFLSVYSESEVEILEPGVGKDAGYAAASRISGKLKDESLDGIACVNDITAVGAGYAAAEAGLDIGKTLPLAGYDNLPLDYVLPFKLLSVDIMPDRIYSEAASALLDSLTGAEIVSKTVVPRVVG